MIKKFSKIFALILTLVFSASYYTQTLTFSSTNPAVAAANVTRGSSKVPIYSAKIVASGFNGAGANLSSVKFTPTGSFNPTDISKYQFWYNTTNNLATATNTGPDVTTIPTSGQQVTLSPYNPFLGDGQTWYVWITADIKSTAVANRTLTVNALTTSNFTFSSGNKTGTMSVGGTQTLSSGANLSVSATSFSNFYYCISAGPSNVNTLTISGNGLNGTAVTATAPTNYEISTSSTGTYGSSLNLGTKPQLNSTIYIRMKAGLPVGNYTGTLTVSGGGATTQNVSLSGNVSNCITCSGSLGEPIVNETFGTGSNPGAPLSYVSGLTYQSVDCPDDGYYAVRNVTNNCFNGAWRNGIQDHTPGDTNGYMLMINAPIAPGPQFYKKTITGLCAGTVLKFSAWLINPHTNTSSTLPNVTFNIYRSDGTTLIATYNTGPIALAASNTDWKQYELTFAMPTGESSIVLQIANLTPGGLGSDIFVDDIQLRACEATLSTSASTTNACVGSAATLTGVATTGVYANPVYQWQRSTDGTNWIDISGATSLVYNQTETIAGTYRYRFLASESGNIGNVNCRVISPETTVVFNTCIDSDGDGIPDSTDLDDDNDGILDADENSCITSSKVEGTPIFINDFGTGTVTTDPYVLNHRYTTGDASDGFYNVRTSGASGVFYTRTNLTGNKDAGNPTITNGTTTGRYLMINIDSPNNTNKAIYRVTGINIQVGQSYRFRIDMAGLAEGSADIPNLKIAIKDASNNELASANSSSLGMANDDIWRRVNLEFTATTSNVVLEIINQQPNGGNGNDVGIDNIILTPLYCDLDNDGTPNQFDLDSDNDGCPDAIEGDENVTAAHLNPSGSIIVGANGSGSLEVNANGVPKLVNGTTHNATGGGSTAAGVADIGNDQGQGIGDSQNAAVNSQCNAFCYKPAQTTGTTLDTNHGITALGRAGADNSNWPMVRKGAWTVLEAKTKGFVVNRLTDAQVSAIPSADLREGMMVYNITQDCLQINIDGTATGWRCFNTQTCPD